MAAAVVHPAAAKAKPTRAERRALQRIQNVGRAESMHRLRLCWAGSENTGAKTQSAPVKYHVGCSGWYYWDWKGKFYPDDLPTGQWFKFYANRFNTVELNASFYSWPLPTTVRNWSRQAAKALAPTKLSGFGYTVKVCELITHTKRFEGTKILLKDFGLIADMLGPLMGCFLFQLPPSFAYTPARLKRILSQLDPSRRNVIEFRHASWWTQKVFNAFREAGAIFCTVSAPRLPDQMVKTNDEVYVRFHGTERWYRHDYSQNELVTWARKIHESGAKHVWIYFNNDYEGFAIKNAQLLHKILKKLDKKS